MTGKDTMMTSVVFVMSIILIHTVAGVRMGARKGCDDGKKHLAVDWNPSTEKEYTCDTGYVEPKADYKPEINCEARKDQKHGIHRCLPMEILYKGIPTSGVHRPVWAAYGEYKYCPPQRWLHNLEHSGIVMLYHPCANTTEVDELRQLLKGCLRRRIITPSKLLDQDKMNILKDLYNSTIHYIQRFLDDREKERHRNVVRLLIGEEPTEEDLDWTPKSISSSVDPQDYLDSPVDNQETIWRAYTQYMTPILEARNKAEYVWYEPGIGVMCQPYSKDMKKSNNYYEDFHTRRRMPLIWGTKISVVVKRVDEDYDVFAGQDYSYFTEDQGTPV